MTAAAPALDLELEIRPIPGWPGYAATSDGLILGKSGEPLRPSQHWRTGHLRVRLYGGSQLRHAHTRNGKARAARCQDFYVHVLVAMAFLGPRPSPDHRVLHWDDHPEHNWPGNLRWGSYSENAEDRRRNSVDSDGFDWATGEIVEGSAA